VEELYRRFDPGTVLSVNLLTTPIMAVGSAMTPANHISRRKWELFMLDWQSQLPPSSLLILGIISFSGAVVSTCTGKTRARVGRTIYRATEPSTFWWVVAIYYVGSLLFVGLYLHQTGAI
jgi:hypothetical protein